MSHAVLWTGGKDSCLALHEALDAGWPVRELITFAPPAPEFLAHPVAAMRLQARALDLPHRLLTVSEPFQESYRRHIHALRGQGIDTLITGDIAEVGGSPNWIRLCSEPTGMEVRTPLWGRDRLKLLEQLLARDLSVVLSCVQTRWLSADWVGRALDAAAICELQARRAENGMDLCGEEGEYHTLVVDSPRFGGRLEFDGLAMDQRDSLACLRFTGVSLVPKPGFLHSSRCTVAGEKAGRQIAM